MGCSETRTRARTHEIARATIKRPLEMPARLERISDVIGNLVWVSKGGISLEIEESEGF